MEKVATTADGAAAVLIEETVEVIDLDRPVEVVGPQMVVVEEMDLVQDEVVWVDQEEVEEEVVVVSEDLEMAVQGRIQGLVVVEEVADKRTDLIIKCKYVVSNIYKNCYTVFLLQLSLGIPGLKNSLISVFSSDTFLVYLFSFQSFEKNRWASF